jgi:dCMP deaminase
MRLSRDVYYMKIAVLVAERATCMKNRVGAVLVKDNRIVSTGYNGSPRGLPHCTDVGCEIVDGHCVRTTHAEQNALIECARHGAPSDKSTMYVTSSPCYSCAKMLINAGVSRVCYFKEYSSEVVKYLADAGVQMDRIVI